jgi:predicted DNA-binding protein (MmcQ/YjbR family)
VTEDPFHERLIAIVKTLPGAYEDRPWGSVHCKVAEKIFVGWGRHESGEMGIGFKTDKSLQAMLVASDPRFSIAKYVGKHGWVDMKIGKRPNWDEIEQFIVDSYRRIAPKKLVKQLDNAVGDTPRPERAGAPAPQREARAAAVRRTQSSVSKSANKTKTTMAMAKPSPKRATKQSGGRASARASSKKSR